MYKNKKVSCVIPAFNEGPRIKSVLEPLLQIKSLDEIVVVNDGSTDNTQSEVESLLEENSHLELINLSENQGKGYALSEGIELAKNPIIVLVDADMFGFTESHFQKLLGELIDNKNDLVTAIAVQFSSLITIFQTLISVFQHPITGIRAFEKKSVEHLLDSLRDSRYGVDILVYNDFVKTNKKIKNINLNNVRAICKVEKELSDDSENFKSVIKALYKELKMMRNVVKTTVEYPPLPSLEEFTKLVESSVKETKILPGRKRFLRSEDLEVFDILKSEEKRQQEKLCMIPSENFTSRAIREVVGSVFMNKYSEGYPAARYYEGAQNVDQLENLAISRAKKLFELPEDWDVNVQPLSGSPANLAVYLALLKPGDKIMSMYLPDGGHLSHGWSYEPKSEESENNRVYYGGKRKVNVVSKIYNIVQYKTDPKTQLFDYDELERIAIDQKPKMIVTGGTAYPREIDYKKMRKIADKVGAFYMADIAHEAGLIAAGVNKTPVGIADVVTMTTHKTLRCNRGAMILSRSELMKKINRAIFPGLQGGPHNHSIAGIAVGLKEAMQPEFHEYAKQIIINAQTLAKELDNYGFDIVSGGTDKHMVLINLTSKGVFGRKYARALDYAGIVANKNTMPGEKRSPADPSALRIGTPWITTRGMQETEMQLIASWMNDVMEIIKDWNDLDFEEFDKKCAKSKKLAKIADSVENLCWKFPLSV